MGGSLIRTTSSSQLFLLLVHSSDQSVDLVFSVSRVTAIVEVSYDGSEATGGVVQLEGPEESAGFLEVRSDSHNLVDQIFNTDDSEFSKRFLDDSVVGNGDSLTVDLSESSLVDEFLNGLKVGVAIGNVGLDQLEHREGGLVQLDKCGIVDLSKSEELQDLSGLGVQLVDTSDSDNEGEFRLGLDVEVARGLSLSLEGKERLLSVSVFLDVLFGSLEDDFSLNFSGLSEGSDLLLFVDGLLRSGSSFFENGLGDGGSGLSTKEKKKKIAV